MKKALTNFIQERRVGIVTLRNHSLYGDQSKKAKMLREERANGQEWLIDRLESLIEKEAIVF